MNLDNVRLLIQVVDEGSVQRAARSLGVSRTTLRRRLENLEAEIGSGLLVAGTSGVKLTTAGAVVVEHGRRLLEETARMLSRVKTSKNNTSGTLRLIIPAGMPCEPRLTLATLHHTANPGLTVDAREVEDPLMYLHEPFELMVYYGDAMDRGGWFSRVLRRLPIQLAAAPEYLARAGTPARADALADHELLGWRVPGRSPNRWPLLAGGEIEVRPWLVSADIQVLHDVAEAGGGIFFGPPIDELPGARQSRLVPVLTDVVGTTTALRTLSPYPANVEPRVRAALQVIQSFLAQLPSG